MILSKLEDIVTGLMMVMLVCMLGFLCVVLVSLVLDDGVPKENTIAEIEMPDGSVVSGTVEKMHYDCGRYTIQINGITYTAGRDDVVIVRGGVGVEQMQ